MYFHGWYRAKPPNEREESEDCMLLIFVVLCCSRFLLLRRHQNTENDDDTVKPDLKMVLSSVQNTNCSNAFSSFFVVGDIRDQVRLQLEVVNRTNLPCRLSVLWMSKTPAWVDVFYDCYRWLERFLVAICVVLIALWFSEKKVLELKGILFLKWKESIKKRWNASLTKTEKKKP